MSENPYHLLTAIEAEKKFGNKFFYRQKLYRFLEKGKIVDFNLRDKTCFLGSHILEVFIKDLEFKIQKRFPEIDINELRIFYDVVNEKRIVVDGLFGSKVIVNTDKENEEDLLSKISNVLEWISNQDDLSKNNDEEQEDKLVKNKKKDMSLVDILPEEITWIKVDTKIIEGVEVKSYILISIPSIAQFMGVRPDVFTRWISKTTFSNYVLSAHYKQFQGTQNSVPWKKGVIDGYTPLIPFELIPEILIAFRQSGNKPKYQEKAKMLYELSKNTLEAVGLAISGNKDKAAEELARVGSGLGLTVAEQIIGVFKQYEARDFQIKTTREFHSKIKDIGANYAITIGSLTLGITGRYPDKWKALGTSRNLPKKISSSSREVMRELSPADGVGMTFGEKHFTKDPDIDEAVKTGRQGKDFYTRLKKVGLLDDNSNDKNGKEI